MSHAAEVLDPGMELRDLLTDSEFFLRQQASGRTDRQFEALNQLAHVFAEAPNVVLQKLVDIAVEFCGADSAGISLEEPDEKGELRFRWIVVSGSFSSYLNGTTPRFFSPCGTCLSTGRPQLYRVTRPYYEFLGVTAEPITDGMLIPWSTGETRGTIWAISHHSREAFNAADYKLLNSLADFAAIAIRHQQQGNALLEHEKDMASSARANQLAHQINNPLQSLTNSLYLALHGEDPEGARSYLEQACQELEAVSALVREILVVSRSKK